MSIKKTIIAAIVGLTLVAVVAPGAVQALTVQDLLTQIQQLQAQLVQLQGQEQSGSTTNVTPSVCVGITFSRNLSRNMTGSDVKCLQALLNQLNVNVANTGAGSPGSETTFFGGATRAAVIRFQTLYSISPASGFVGPLTRAKLNGLLGGTVVPPPVVVPPTTGCPAGAIYNSITGAPCPTTPVVVPTGTGLTVQLASDNPAAGTVVDTQGLAPLAKFTFVNGDNTEVKVTSLKLKRTGISADATLTNVYLFDGAKRITDSASVASTVINFNDSTGVFTVPAGSSKTISVLADVDGSVGETVAVQVVAATDVTTNASSVKGNFPVTGNLFTLAAGTNLATIYMADETGTVSPATASIDPQNDYAIWYDNMIVGTRAVNLQRIAFRVGGSVNRTTDIRNFRLLIDGTQAGSAVASADANDYVTFDLSAAPVKLETGTRVIKVLADIIGGSNKNVYLSLRTAADVSAVDSQIGATLLLHRYTTSTSFTAEDSGTQSINSGTLTVTKLTTSPSGNITDLSNNAVLAKFELKAAGERVKVESLRVSATTNDASVGLLRNGAIYANGVQIGSTTDLQCATNTGDTNTADYTTYSFGSSLIVEPGSPVTLEVRADIYDNDGTNTSLNTNTIVATIEGGDLNNAYGMVSMATVDVPSADVTGNTLTVATGTLSLSKYTAYTSRNAVVPLTDYKLAHFTLTAGTTEAVNINTIYVFFNEVSAYVSNFYVKFGNNTTAVKSAATASGTDRSEDSWSVNYTLAAGATVDVMVYGNISSSANHTATTGMYITGTTANSAAAVVAGTNDDATTGQTITFTTGSLSTAVDGNTPLAQAVYGGQSVAVGKFDFTASNDSYTIKELKFLIAGTTTTSAVAQSLTLKDGSTVLATVPYNVTNGNYYVTGLTVAVPANTTKVLTAELNLATPYTDGKGGTADASTVTTGLNAKITLDNALVADSQGTESNKGDNKVANYTYVYKSVPTFTVGTITGQGTALTSGSPVEMYKFSVTANGPAGTVVSLKQMKFNVTITDGGSDGTPSINTMSFFRGSDPITDSVAIIDKTATSLEAAASSLTESNTSAVYVVFDTEEVIPAGTTYTYTLKGTPSGFIGSSTTGGDTVSTSVSQDTVPSDGSASGGTAGNNQTGYYLGATATDSVIQTLETYAGIGGKTGTGLTANGNVIWSDNSAQLHSYDYLLTSSDWFNGYLLKSFPMATIGIGYNN